MMRNWGKPWGVNQTVGKDLGTQDTSLAIKTPIFVCLLIFHSTLYLSVVKKKMGLFFKTKSTKANKNMYCPQFQDHSSENSSGGGVAGNYQFNTQKSLVWFTM